MDRVKIIGEGKPIVGVVGLVHGNEPCGRFAVDSLINIKPKNGTLILIKANLEAEKVNKRFVEVNLNRSFPGRKDGLLEERLAYELFPIVQMCDYLIDLHSTSQPSEPFVIVTEDNNEKSEMVSKLGIKNYIELGGLIDGTLMDNEGVKLTVECGQHNSDSAKEVALKVTYNFLKAVGVIEGETEEIKLSKFRVIKQMIIDNPDSFKFSEDVKPFKLVKEGDYIGSYPDKKMHASIDFYPVLITKKRGNQYLYMMIPFE